MQIETSNLELDTEVYEYTRSLNNKINGYKVEIFELEKYKMSLYHEYLKISSEIEEKNYCVSQLKNDKLYTILKNDFKLNNVVNARFLGWKYFQVIFSNHNTASFAINQNTGSIIYDCSDPDNTDVKTITRLFKTIIAKVET